jgi:hypothetical protein
MNLEDILGPLAGTLPNVPVAAAWAPIIVGLLSYLERWAIQRKAEDDERPPNRAGWKLLKRTGLIGCCVGIAFALEHVGPETWRAIATAGLAAGTASGAHSITKRRREAAANNGPEGLPPEGLP